MKGLDLGGFKRWWLQRPAREKLMLFACSLGVVLALGDSLVITPVEKRLRLARTTEEQLQARWDQLQSRQKGQTAQDKGLIEQEKALRLRLQAAQARVGEMNRSIGDTAQLPDVLRTLVATMGTTRLLELSFADDGAGAPAQAPAAAGTGLGALAAGVAAQVAAVVSPGQAAGVGNTAATSSTSAATTSSTTAATTAASTTTTGTAGGNSANNGWVARRIYRLPVTLKVSGSWAELNALLAQIETRAPALQWQVLSLDNSEWPAIQLTLRAHVRSLQPRWGAGP